jgi:protein involved in polysaccharide export with SLBB domain
MTVLTIFITIMPVNASNDGQNSDITENTTNTETPEIEALGLSQSTVFPFQPGDGLDVNTFPDTSSFLNRTFAIDDRGYVDFPLVGRVNVMQMTEDQLIGFIKNNFKNYTRSPNVSVKPMLRLSMIGGFISPGLYYVDYGNSFWEAIRLAGGPVREDGFSEMKWERNGKKMIADLTPFIQQGVSLKQMGFKSGDIIWTPSPDAETTWDIVTRDVLPIMAFVTTLGMLYITYLQTTLIYTTR